MDEGGVRVAMLASMGRCSSSRSRSRSVLRRRRALFGCAYAVVRLLHVALSAIVARGDPGRRSALLRFAPDDDRLLSARRTRAARPMGGRVRPAHAALAAPLPMSARSGCIATSRAMLAPPSRTPPTTPCRVPAASITASVSETRVSRLRARRRGSNNRRRAGRAGRPARTRSAPHTPGRSMRASWDP